MNVEDQNMAIRLLLRVEERMKPVNSKDDMEILEMHIDAALSCFGISEEDLDNPCCPNCASPYIIHVRDRGAPDDRWSEYDCKHCQGTFMVKND